MALKNKDRSNCLETLGLKENATEGKCMHAFKLKNSVANVQMHFYILSRLKKLGM